MSWSPFNAIGSWLYSLAAWVLGLLKDVAAEIATYAVSHLPSGWADFLAQNPLNSTLKPLVQAVAYFVPVAPAAGIVVTALGLAGGIRVTRWILSFVPWPGLSS